MMESNFKGYWSWEHDSSKQISENEQKIASIISSYGQFHGNFDTVATVWVAVLDHVTPRAWVLKNTSVL